MKSPYPALRLEISIAIAKLQAMLQDINIQEAKELGLSPALFGVAPAEPALAPAQLRAPRARRAARILPLPTPPDMASDSDESVGQAPPRRRGRPRKVTPPPRKLPPLRWPLGMPEDTDYPSPQSPVSPEPDLNLHNQGVAA